MSIRTYFIRRQRKRVGANQKYLAWVRSLPCLVCGAHSEAAHVGMRGLGQKCPDKSSIPLCVNHHRTGKFSHHVMGKRFWSHHSISLADTFTDLHKRYHDETGEQV